MRRSERSRVRNYRSPMQEKARASGGERCSVDVSSRTNNPEPAWVGCLEDHRERVAVGRRHRARESTGPTRRGRGRMMFPGDLQLPNGARSVQRRKPAVVERELARPKSAPFITTRKIFEADGQRQRGRLERPERLSPGPLERGDEHSDFASIRGKELDSQECPLLDHAGGGLSRHCSGTEHRSAEQGGPKDWTSGHEASVRPGRSLVLPRWRGESGRTSPPKRRARADGRRLRTCPCLPATSNRAAGTGFVAETTIGS